MIDQPLKYCYADEDRHGNVRFYFWRGKAIGKSESMNNVARLSLSSVIPSC